MNWRPIATAPKDGSEILVSDGGFIVQAMWDEVDYSEFWGKGIYDWTYGPANIDNSNFSPTHWTELPELPTNEQE